jgi:hypothetical protein
MSADRELIREWRKTHAAHYECILEYWADTKQFWVKVTRLIDLDTDCNPKSGGSRFKPDVKAWKFHQLPIAVTRYNEKLAQEAVQQFPDVVERLIRAFERNDGPSYSEVIEIPSPTGRNYHGQNNH